MIIEAFLDDSADQFQSQVEIYAGYTGRKDQWDRLTKQWRKRLRQDGLDYFRSTECRSLRGQFIRFRDPVRYPDRAGKEAAQHVRDDLKQIIVDSGVVGWGIGVLVQDYEDVMQLPNLAGTLNRPDDAAFQSVIYEIAKRARKLKGHHRVAYICDESTKSDHLHALYRSFKEQNPISARIMGGMISLDDKCHPPLQAADLMAHLTKDILIGRAKILQKSQVEREFIEKSTCLIGYWDKRYILSVIRDTTGEKNFIVRKAAIEELRRVT